MKEDNNEIKTFSTKLIKSLEKENKDVEVFSETDPMLTLRKDILSFFRSIMASVAKKEQLKEKIESSFLEDLEAEELSIQDRMSLYKLISSQSNIAADSILSIFKPTPGAPSLLADNLSKDTNEDHFDKMYDSMKPDDLQKMDKLMKVLQTITREADVE